MKTVRQYLLPALVAVFVSSLPIAQAQQEGPATTQALIAVDAKKPITLTTSNVTLKVENHDTPLLSLVPVKPSGAQVALLIDDGLRTSVGRELGTLRTFIQSLPVGTEVLVGYMQNGRVASAGGFTKDLAAAAGELRIPLGSPGLSASPYFCVSDFVKNWPEAESDSGAAMAPLSGHKARFVLMITDGVDPYNGSTSMANQNSPYVDAATIDAQRVGVPVYSIYYSDAGIRGGRASFSGQSYLQEVADGTGGQAYYLGTGNPVSMTPFLNQFKTALSETYIATFQAPADKKFVRVKLSSGLHGAKLRVSQQVRPGTLLGGPTR